MNQLRIAEHSIHWERKAVEIHHPTMGLIGVIYPTESGVRIVSKYLSRKRIAIDPVEPPALEIFIP